MTAAAAPITETDRASLAVTLAATVVASMPVFLTGALGVEVERDLGVSVTELGAAVSACFGISGLASNFAGRLSRRLGPRQTLRVSSLVTGSSMLGLATVAHSFAALVVCLGISGVGHSLTQPAVNALLIRRVAIRRLGLAFGVRQSAIPVVVLLSGISVPALALTVGWRAVFVVAAAFAVGTSIFAGTLDETARPGAPAQRTGTLATGRILVVLGIAGGLGAMAGNALAVFLVSAAAHAGIDQGKAGLLLAVASLTAVFARIVVGDLADRRQAEGLGIVAILLAVGSLGFLGLTSSAPLLFVVASVLAFAAGWGWPGLFSFAIVLRHPHAPEIATAITQTGMYLGAACGPLIFGGLASLSYGVAWSVMASAVLVAALITLAARSVLAPPPPHPA
jgi:MFS family permease